MDADAFQTIRRAAQVEEKIKGSRFIGHALPAQERDAAEAELAEIRKVYHDASHHGYAYRLGIGPLEIRRFSDDGEPLGTAGRPILQALVAGGVTNVLLVVTRYFGGTKLGVGGLARAYGQTAASALALAGQRQVLMMEDLALTVPYELYGVVQHLVERWGGRIDQVAYDQQVAMQVSIRKSAASSFQEQIIEQSNGKIKIRME